MMAWSTLDSVESGRQIQKDEGRNITAVDRCQDVGQHPQYSRLSGIARSEAGLEPWQEVSSLEVVGELFRFFFLMSEWT